MLTGCMQDNRDGRVIEKSHRKRPKWIQHSFLESKHYVYFIQHLSADVHSPSFAYRAAKRNMHEYMRKDVNALYQPMKKLVGESTYAKETTKFFNVVSADIMTQIREEKAVYYEVLQVNINERIKNKYDYTVAIRLRKKAFRSAQKRFLIRQRRVAELSQKTLLLQTVNHILEDLEKIKAEEHAKSLTLEENLVEF